MVLVPSSKKMIIYAIRIIECPKIPIKGKKTKQKQKTV